MLVRVSADKVKLDNTGIAEICVPNEQIPFNDQREIVAAYVNTVCADYFEQLCDEAGLNANDFDAIPEFCDRWEAITNRDTLDEIITTGIDEVVGELFDEFKDQCMRKKYVVEIEVTGIIRIPVIAKDEDEAEDYVNNMYSYDDYMDDVDYEYNTYDVKEDDSYSYYAEA